MPAPTPRMRTPPPDRPGWPGPTARGARTVIAGVLTILALLLVWAALVAPDQPIAPQARRVPEGPARGPRPHRGGARPARQRSTRILAWVVGPAARAGGRPEGPQHRVLHRLRPAVRHLSGRELRRDRHRDAARLDRALAGEPDRRSGWACCVVGATRPHDACDAAGDPGRGRPSPVGAAGRRGARRRLGPLLGVRRAARLPHADRLHDLRRPGRRRGERACGPTSTTDAVFAKRDQPRRVRATRPPISC